MTYFTVEKEDLASKKALKKRQYYLFGWEFDLEAHWFIYTISVEGQPVVPLISVF